LTTGQHKEQVVEDCQVVPADLFIMCDNLRLSTAQSHVLWCGDLLPS